MSFVSLSGLGYPQSAVSPMPQASAKEMESKKRELGGFIKGINADEIRKIAEKMSSILSDNIQIENKRLSFIETALPAVNPGLSACFSDAKEEYIPYAALLFEQGMRNDFQFGFLSTAIEEGHHYLLDLTIKKGDHDLSKTIGLPANIEISWWIDTSRPATDKADLVFVVTVKKGEYASTDSFTLRGL